MALVSLSSLTQTYKETIKKLEVKNITAKSGACNGILSSLELNE